LNKKLNKKEIIIELPKIPDSFDSICNTKKNLFFLFYKLMLYLVNNKGYIQFNDASDFMVFRKKNKFLTKIFSIYKVPLFVLIDDDSKFLIGKIINLIIILIKKNNLTYSDSDSKFFSIPKVITEFSSLGVGFYYFREYRNLFR
jgi:hypothetical protein